MGAYQFMRDEVDDSNGIKRTADGAMIPPDEETKSWADYLIWKAVPNTPDPSTATDLDDYKEAAKAEVDRVANQSLMTEGAPINYHQNPALAWAMALMLQEAIDFLEETDSATRFPIMEELTDDGASRTIRAAAVLAEYNAGGSPELASRVGQILKAKRKAYADIDAAGNLAAVDAVNPVSFPVS